MRKVALATSGFKTVVDYCALSPAGSRIDIRATRDGELVEIEVVDEGPGIPPADFERIFDKFYRVQKGDQVRAGTGLGLAISRGFVEALHGTITAANRTDRSGAVFTVMLPAQQATEQHEVAA